MPENLGHGRVLITRSDIQRLRLARPDYDLPEMEAILRFTLDGGVVGDCMDFTPSPPDSADLFSLAELTSDVQAWLQVHLDGWKAAWPPAGLDHEWRAARALRKRDKRG